MGFDTFKHGSAVPLLNFHRSRKGPNFGASGGNRGILLALTQGGLEWNEIIGMCSIANIGFILIFSWDLSSTYHA